MFVFYQVGPKHLVTTDDLCGQEPTNTRKFF